MAIVFEQKRKPVNWIGLLSATFGILFLIFAVYYLFFAPSPKLEAVLPAPLERASQISELEFIEPTIIINDPNFRKLQNYAGPPGVGTLGRANPFVKL